MRRLPRVLVRTREAVREHDVFAGRLAIHQGLEHDVVAALRRWRAIPRAMERDECAALIAVRTRAALINRKIVRRPMPGKGGDGCILLRADANLVAAVAAIFGRQNELVLLAVEVAFRPAVIGTLFSQNQFLGRLSGALFGRIEFRKILCELVSAVHGRKQAAGGIKAEPFAIAQPGQIALRRREMLAGLVGVVTPGAGAGLEFRAGLVPKRVRHAVVDLT